MQRPTPEHLSHEYADDYFSGGGSGYPDYLAGGSLVTAHATRYVRLIEPFLRAAHDGEPTRWGTMLDIGCAAGFVMQGFAQAGWQVSGVDPNATMVRHAREALGLDAWVGTLETVHAIDGLTVPADGYDLVSLVQVIAHFYDLSVAMAALRQLVRPGGLVLVETWNSASLMARILGRRWHEYNPPNVLHNFTARSLDEQMQRLGMSRVAGGRPTKRISASHLRSALKHKYGNQGVGGLLQGTAALLPDGLVVPYPAEDLMWRLYRREVAG